MGKTNFFTINAASSGDIWSMEGTELTLPIDAGGIPIFLPEAMNYTAPLWSFGSDSLVVEFLLSFWKLVEDGYTSEFWYYSVGPDDGFSKFYV